MPLLARATTNVGRLGARVELRSRFLGIRPERASDPRVRIVESNEDPLVYPAGHVPGAVEIDWTRDLNDPVRRDYLDGERFAAWAARASEEALS